MENGVEGLFVVAPRQSAWRGAYECGMPQFSGLFGKVRL
jgi:hypothetical protein